MNLSTFRRPIFKASDPAAPLFIPCCLIKALRIKAAFSVCRWHRCICWTSSCSCDHAASSSQHTRLCTASRKMIYNLILKQDKKNRVCCKKWTKMSNYVCGHRKLGEGKCVLVQREWGSFLSCLRSSYGDKLQENTPTASPTATLMQMKL